MELQLYDPAYYSQTFGIDRDIHAFLAGLTDFFRDKTYSPVINVVRIGPVAAPENVLAQGLWKEFVRCWPSSGDASVSLQLDYEEYVHASPQEKKRLLAENIIRSMEQLRRKGKVDIAAFRKDVTDYCRHIGVNL
ncbi:MAG: hypothetical protein IKK21_02305 [Clostridia bacterium]|nr:hypothetical protein [Clostridia bacterium]